MNLLDKNMMAVMYFIFLLYLFLGISIIADIFMEAIEVICSKTRSVEVSDKEGKRYSYDVPVWNATIANLTLMALGSSAPEIMLSVIDTLNTLGETPGELGVFSIVGSAAFNLLFISGVCILCVEGDKPKQIFDLGVFAVTSLFSLFAYVWMYVVLSDELVTMAEAWLTLIFFFVLVFISYGADRFKDYTEKKKLTAT
jgi:solute carrier family 8 (sodium/calcium exchanger)